jgi:hypothetical protein
MPVFTKDKCYDRKVRILYPQDRVISAKKLLGWIKDAVASGECPHLPEDWQHCLELANEYLDITLATGYDNTLSNGGNDNALYDAQYAHACGYQD